MEGIKEKLGLAAKNKTEAPVLFMTSSSIVAKVAFSLLAVILSIILFRIGINIIAWYHSPSVQPRLVAGVLSGKSALTISQNPSVDNGVPILRSNNENTGMEFTWSVWLDIFSLPTSTECSHVFNKGTLRSETEMTKANLTDGLQMNKTSIGTTTEIGLMESPGLYITSSAVSNAAGEAIAVTNGYQAQLVVVMSTSDNKLVNIPINNIPLNKWINVVIRLQNTVLDVYINGTIAKRYVFVENVPQQSYGDVYVCQNGGFIGNISDLRYFNKALSIFGIQGLVNSGPNLQPSQHERQSGKSGGSNYFLDNSWYTQRFN